LVNKRLLLEYGVTESWLQDNIDPLLARAVDLKSLYKKSRRIADSRHDVVSKGNVSDLVIPSKFKEAQELISMRLLLGYKLTESWFRDNIDPLLIQPVHGEPE